MTIKAVKPGGWPVNSTPQAVEFAQIDERLANGLDGSSAGDTATGTLSLVQDPLYPTIAPTLIGNAEVSAAGAVFGTGPGGGSLICTNSVPTYLSGRTRKVRFSPLEAMLSFYGTSDGDTPKVDPNSGGFSQANTSTGTSFAIPLTKPHHLATLSTLGIYFYVPSIPAALPTGALEVLVTRTVVATSVVAIIGAAQLLMSGFATPTAWYAGGAVQNLFINGGALIPFSGPTNVIDLTAYLYRVVIQGPVTTSTTMFPAPIFTGIEVNYASIADETFPQ